MNNKLVLEGIVFYNGDNLELRTFLRDETFTPQPTTIILDHDPRNLPEPEHLYRVFGQPRTCKDGIRFYAETFVRLK